MKIFVKPNPFWRIILYTIGVISIMCTTFIFVLYDRGINTSIGLAFLASIIIDLFILTIGYIIGLPLFWLADEIYKKYKLSYPKKEKSEKIQKFKDPIDYEVNIYKNKLKN